MDEQMRGRVVDGAGRGVADATVMVLRAPGPVPDIAAVSDADGRFVFDSLPAGTYRLRAVGPDGRQGEADVTVPGSGEYQEGVIIRLSGPSAHY
ncbi:MAG TPA: hypothetical protein DGT23_01240 [Micromonosporaceae bacterium]|nr:hypothetical protein [Micromonosporaceae bacterium]